jgi:non-canonical (house-cleaning) NTP pyrophosphatase
MKYLLLISFFISFHLITAQNQIKSKITISFENTNIFGAIKQIEENTGYRFYFVEDWLEEKTISGQYNNIDINTLLDEVFKNTVLNYYISPDNKIILTRSILIYDSLPDDFMRGSKNESIQEEKSEPIVYKGEASTNRLEVETVRIGKESKTSKQNTYILSGHVKNMVTNEPIENLAFIVQNKNINAVTDRNGFYSIELPSGINIIETKSIGLKDTKKRVIIYNNGTLNYSLSESFELLDELIIQADRDRNIKEAITGVTQIQVKEIKNIPLILGERDILKVATTLPGITKAGEGSAGYNVRGGKEDQNLILLDNGVLYNPSHFFGIFSALNPFTSGDVNIYKGHIPSEYGGRLSSVFDINTKNGNNQNFSGEASLGPVTSNVTLEVPVIKDRSALIFGARGTYSDWILKMLDEESLKNSKASFYDVVAKYNFKINENNNLETTGYYSNDAFSITSDSLYTYSNTLASLKWDHQFNEKNRSSLILVNSEYKFNIDYEGNSNNNFNLNYKINETQLKLKLKYLHSDRHKFDYGISSKLYVVNPGSIKPNGSESIVEIVKIPKERALESAVFISDNFEVNKKLLINLGIRYSFYASLGESSQRVYVEGLPRTEGNVIDSLYFSKNEVIKTNGGPELRTSVRYFISPNFSVKASFNNTYQYIHTLSNNTTASPTDTWKLSDLNIKPQQASQFALGFYKNLEGNNYEFSLEGYYKKSKNLLNYKVGADLLLNEHIETEVLPGLGKAYGIEFLIKKNQGKLNGWLGYSYSRSLIKLDSEFNEERVNNGNYFPSNFDKPHDLSLVTNYKITKRYSFSANFTYQTGRPVTYPTGKFIYNGEEHVVYSDYNKFRIPDYYRLDIGLNIEGNHKIKKFAHSFWNISIYNVLGRNNPYSVYFVTEDGKIKAYKSSIFSIPVPTITYNFKF